MMQIILSLNSLMKLKWIYFICILGLHAGNKTNKLYFFLSSKNMQYSVVYKIQFLFAQVEVIYIHASAGWKKLVD